jgi:hypothetical protein
MKKSSERYTYKAGDFTSGKMGKIFKQCFSEDKVIINHKQFGRFYMVSEDIFANDTLITFLDKCGVEKPYKNHPLLSCDRELQFALIDKSIQENNPDKWCETTANDWCDLLAMVSEVDIKVKWHSDNPLAL